MAPVSGMVALGFGTFVRADRIVAVLPLEPEQRGGGRRTYVHVDGVAGPVVASRSERAILADLERVLVEVGGRQATGVEAAADDGLRRLFGRQRRTARR